MRVELPDGAWAEFHAPDKVTERKRRPLLEAMDAMDGAAGAVKLSEMSDLLVVALVQAWSFGSDPSVDALMDLPVGAVDKMRSEAAPFLKDLLPDFGVSPDPKATTEPSPSSEPG